MYKKNLLLASILMLPLTTSAFANAEETAAASPLANLDQELALTEEQKAKLQTIFKTQQEKLRAVHQESDALIRGVLNEEQIAKWEAARQQLIERQKEMIRRRQSQQ
ncbi:MAG: hypothetical protein ACU836_11715 [Gammaproteobacteria bacterium]